MTRFSQRLIVAGALLNPGDARQVGIVDALADDPQSAVTAALDWCRQLLALPRQAMLGNRARARQDLYDHFDSLDEAAVESFVNGWFEESTQATLRGLVEQLKSKK